MNLLIKRKWYTAASCIGELSIDGEVLCYTLEDPPRLYKKPTVTGIPAGTYPIELTLSKRFHKTLPLVKNVPGFSGIRIHVGNYPADTAGCILVGMTKGTDFVGQSQMAFNKLMQRLTGVDDITLTIEDTCPIYEGEPNL